MGRITALEPQKDPERVNVHLDGRFAFGASLMVIMARGLAVGREITGTELDELLHDDAVERSYGQALNYLSYRPRSTREIRDYFRRKGVEENIVEAVVARLQRVGLLDDRDFARFWVENRAAFRPRGTVALRAEMRRKGLDGEVIEEALDTLDGEEERAYRAGKPKVRTYARLDEREFLQKMISFLQRRGFPYSAASPAARRLLTDTDPEAEQPLEE